MSYMLIVFIVVGLISFAANINIRDRFTSYVMNKQEKQTDEIIKSIRLKYEEDNKFDTGYLSILGMNSLEKGMIIEVFDADNRKIWSAYEHNNGLCQDMIMNMKANMYSYSGNWKGDYEEKNYPVTVAGQKVGSVTTGFIGPYYFNDEELNFIEALNRVFLIIGACALAAAFILGILMSYRISEPLDKIAKKALQLSEGKYRERLTGDSGMKEIAILSETINNLSDALKNKDELRKQLTQDVAHELRTPITSVQGHMEAMIDGIWPMDKERLTSCYEEIIRIKRLIGRIDVLSGLENENAVLYRKEFDLSKLIARLMNNFEKELITKDLSFCFTEKKTQVYADEDKMSQVFNNLISNAIKYTQPGGRISIELNDVRNSVEIRVKDNGIGIEASDLEHIFERFYRADKSRNSKTGGMGVGLTITKNIIEAHGGTITVNSLIGIGTEFLIILPNQ